MDLQARFLFDNPPQNDFHDFGAPAKSVVRPKQEIGNARYFSVRRSSYGMPGREDSFF
jgi:hypothetical protein